jgi:hypothetical protein
MIYRAEFRNFKPVTVLVLVLVLVALAFWRSGVLECSECA